MALTDDESRRLHEIASALGRSDPWLDHALTTGRARAGGSARVIRSAGAASAVIALILGSVGVGLASAVTCMIAWFFVLLAVALRCAGGM